MYDGILIPINFNFSLFMFNSIFNFNTFAKGMTILFGLLGIFSISTINASAQVSNDIIDLGASNADFTTLVSALEAADLVDTLRSDGPFTVLAPTKAAFDNLPHGVLDALLMPQNQDILSKVLTYHVISGTLDSNMVLDNVGSGGVTTVEGQRVYFGNFDNGLFVNDMSEIIATDLFATNGVVHVIDEVLIPFDLNVNDLLDSMQDDTVHDDFIDANYHYDHWSWDNHWYNNEDCLVEPHYTETLLY